LLSLVTSLGRILIIAPAFLFKAGSILVNGALLFLAEQSLEGAATV
jgi:hypothetical protein